MKTLAAAIQARPWIWLIVANLAILTALFTLGYIAQTHAHQFAPVIPAATHR